MRTFASRLLIIGLFAVLAHEPASAFDAARLPIAPMLPTLDDCRQLDLEYNRLLSANFAGWETCQKQDPIFGLDHLRSQCPGFNSNGSSTTAWVQCEGFVDDNCELDRRQSRESALCRSRVHDIEVANAHDRSVRDEKVSHLLALEAEGKKVSILAGSLVGLVKDPYRFLAKALSGQANKAALNALLANGALSKQPGSLAEQVYKFANDTVRLGLQASPDPIIRYIQKTSLDAITSEYKNVFNQLDTALVEMQNFNGRLASTDLRFNLSPLPPMPSSPVQTGPTTRSSPRQDPDCSILDNFAQTSKLRDEDPDKFVALVKRCTK
ncbi:MAG: hypothetical protein ACXU60_01105 [Croceibacterium sp.]